MTVNGTDTDAMFNKGSVLDELGKYQDAITWYDKVLAIDGNNTKAMYNKGIALNNLGKYQEALLGLIRYWLLMKMIQMRCLTKEMC